MIITLIYKSKNYNNQQTITSKELKMLKKLLLIFTCSFPLFLFGADFIVTSSGDSKDANPGDGICDDPSGRCTLRAAIEEANALAGPDTIFFGPAITGQINLGSMLPPLNSDLVIEGPGADMLTISGADNVRIFYAKSGDITINHLTLTNGMALGGSGGNAAGGGMGAGGAILMHEGITGVLDLKVNNVVFENNRAIGGNGMAEGVGGGAGGGGLGGNGGQPTAENSSGGGGGGGGFLGNGGLSADDAGGGGGGFFQDGGDAQEGQGGNGAEGGGGGASAGQEGQGSNAIFIGETNGGSGDSDDGGDAGFGGGGGGGQDDGNGGDGGFGGGGGGSSSNDIGDDADGGDGGFGGGGGSAAGDDSDGGSGGFGGGGAGGASGTAGSAGTSGNGGGSDFGGGAGDDDGNGGGGMGSGGAVFVVSGKLTLTNTSFNNNGTTGGAGGDTDNGGQSLGGAIFIYDHATEGAVNGKSNAEVVIPSGCGLTFSNNSAVNDANNPLAGDGTTVNDNDNVYGIFTGTEAPIDPSCAPVTMKLTAAPITIRSSNIDLLGDACQCEDLKNCGTYFHDTLRITSSPNLDIRIIAATDFFIDVPCKGGSFVTPTIFGDWGTRIPESPIGSGIYKLEFWRQTGTIPTISVTERGVTTAAAANLFAPACLVENCPPGYSLVNNTRFGDPCNCLDDLNCEDYFHDTLTVSTGANLDVRVNSSSNFFIDVPCNSGTLAEPTYGAAGTQLIESPAGSGIYKLEFWRLSGTEPAISILERGLVTPAPSATFLPLCFTSKCSPIPTLNQWGLLIFAMLLMTLGLVLLFNNSRVAVLNASSYVKINNQLFLPFDKERMLKALEHTIIALVLIAATIFMFWGELIIDDVVGLSILAPILAYFIYLVSRFRKGA